MEASGRIPQLSAWLADSGLALLELRGPGTSLRLLRDAPHAEVEQTVEQSERNVVGRAQSVGILRYSHPQTGLALAPVGARIAAGQPLALLQVGPLLLPVLSRQDGIVRSHAGTEGAAVGYGDPVSHLCVGG